MSDTPCACGCGQDAATIERLRERLAKVEALADEWERDIAMWGTNPARTALVTTLRDLRAALAPQNPPQDAANAPEAPGQPGRGEEGSGGRVGVLARALEDAYAVLEPEVLAEDILADPGPLLEVLAEAGVLQRDEDALIHYRYGVNSGTLRARNTRGSIASAIRQHEQRTHGPIGVERIETRTTFAHTTAWEASDARP